MSDSVRPHRRQPTRLPRPWDSPGKNTGVGCHFLLRCMKVKSESEVAQSCLTLHDLMDCSLPGSSLHGILQASVLEWVATAFSVICSSSLKNAIGILIAIVLNLWKALGSMIILPLLILSVHKYGTNVSFHLFIWSLVAFMNVSFASMSFTSFDSLIPRCLIFFDATANVIFLKKFLFLVVCLLLVYRNTTYFCTLICSLQLYKISYHLQILTVLFLPFHFGFFVPIFTV